MICPVCHSDNRTGAKFCDECGAKLEIQASEDLPAFAAGLGSGAKTDSLKDSLSSDLTQNIRVDSSSQPTQVINIPKVEEDTFAGLEESSIDELPTLTAFEQGATLEMPKIGGEDSDSPARKVFSSNESDTKEKKFSVKKALLIILLVVVVAGAAIFGTWYFELWGGHNVPDVCNISAESAQSILEEKGFTVRIDQVKSDDDEGIVLLTDPSAGSRLADGGEVLLHVSVARTVPAVVGMSSDQAKELLDTEGYTNVTYTKQKSNEAEGTVLSISPEAGTKAKAAYAITVTVAEPYTVPDVVGKSSDEATQLLANEGYQVYVSKYYTENQAEGTVVSTSPEANSKLNSGETVTMYVAVSRGAELKEATSSLLASGSTVTLNDTSCLVKSLNSVSYSGNDVTAFSATVQPFTYLLGQLIYGSEQEVSGSIQWDDSNNVVSITTN